MKNRFFLMISLCLISNIAYSMHNDTEREPDLSSYESIHLTDENKNKLQTFIKSQLIQQNQLPENAHLSLEAFVLDKGHRHPQLGQRYIVKTVAKWMSFDHVSSGPDGHVLKSKRHGCDMYEYIFDSGLLAAEVNLSNNTH